MTKVVISTVAGADEITFGYEADLRANGFEVELLERPARRYASVPHIHDEALDYYWQQLERRLGADALILVASPLYDGRLEWQTDADLIDRSARVAANAGVPVSVHRLPEITAIGNRTEDDLFAVSNYATLLAGVAQVLDGDINAMRLRHA